MSVEIIRLDMLPAELRREASRLKDTRTARRVLAIALVLEGSDRTRAAKACCMDRQPLRDWVRRYNVEGIAGLFNRKPEGRKARLGAEQKTKIAGLVEAGPDPDKDCVVRWWRIDLKKKIEALFGVTMHERTVGKPLEVWFQDEARVGQQGTLTRVWAKKGSRPRAPRDRRYDDHAERLV